jgi:hypothetical protein
MREMSNQDLEWLAAQRPDPTELDPAARERALTALVEHTQSRRDHRWLRRVPVFGAIAAVGTAAAAAVVLAVAGSGGSPASGGASAGVAPSSVPSGPAPAVVHHAHAKRAPLLRLADYVDNSGNPGGDATVVARTTITGGTDVTVYDLYTDDGRYFFSPNQSGLAGQVSAGHNLAGGLFAREVAAAKLGDTGNVQTAAQNMADAPDPSHHVPRRQHIDRAAVAAKAKASGVHMTVSPTGLFDNWVWEDSLDALTAGSGDPTVRAGVLKILATLPDVTVTKGTTDGRPTLTLTAGADEEGIPNYTERLTMDADTGVPILFVGGPPAGPASTTVHYKVSRVTLADLKTGRAQ